MKEHFYQDERDYSQMRSLISENQTSCKISPYPSLGDLDFRRYLENTSDGIKKVHLWKNDNGKLIGFFWPDNHDPLMVCHYQNKQLEKDMIAWAEQQKLLSENNAKDSNCLFIDAFDGDIQRTDTLRNLGYKKTELYCYWGIRSIDTPIPAVSVKTGYTIRSLAEKEITQRAQLHSIATGGRKTTKEQYQDLRENAPTYRQDLDLVCIAPNSEMAAFCTVWYDSKSRRGLFEPYGCHPKHRQNGLTYSLLSEGLHRLKAVGAKEVFVAHGGCDSEDADPALELNTKIGFEPFGRDIAWKRRLTG